MNTIAISKFKKHLKQHLQSQSNLDMDAFWQEYIATKNIEFYEFNIDDYIDWIADLVIKSSTSDDNSDNDPMLYSISETKNNKRVSYVFDSYNWIGNHEELYDIVLPVLDKLKFL